MDFTKLKTFLCLKGSIKKLKRQLTAWKRTFANHKSDKGLESKIYKKNTYNSIIKRQITQF